MYRDDSSWISEALAGQNNPDRRKDSRSAAGWTEPLIMDKELNNSI